MAKLVVTEFVSLDGVMQAPGGEEFKYPGWSFEFDRGDDGNQFKLDETMETDVLLIGRVTYESFAGAWPVARRGFRGQVQHHAEVRRLLDPRGPGVEQHDGPQGRRRRRRPRSSSRSIDGIIQVPGASGSPRRCSRATSSTSCT